METTSVVKHSMTLFQRFWSFFEIFSFSKMNKLSQNRLQVNLKTNSVRGIQFLVHV